MRFPQFKEIWSTRFDTRGDEKSIQSIVFASVLIPALEEALSTGNLGTILKISAFLEDAAEDAQNDRALEALLRVEVGEWLERAANVSLLAPWLGTETKRICRYVPGVSAQKIASREEQTKRSLGIRLSTFLKQLRRKL